VFVTFGRVTSNTMEMRVTLCLASGWTGTVQLDNNYIPAALRPVLPTFDKSTSSTLFSLGNLQRLRQDIKVWLHFQLTCGVQCCPCTVSLNLGRPLTAFAYIDRVLTISMPTSLLTNMQTTEHKEAMEHTEDHSSISSDN